MWYILISLHSLLHSTSHEYHCIHRTRSTLYLYRFHYIRRTHQCPLPYSVLQDARMLHPVSFHLFRRTLHAVPCSNSFYIQAHHTVPSFNSFHIQAHHNVPSLNSFKIHALIQHTDLNTHLQLQNIQHSLIIQN